MFPYISIIGPYIHSQKTVYFIKYEVHVVWSDFEWSALGMRWLCMKCFWYEVAWYEVHLVWSTTWYEVPWYEVHLVWSALVWSVVVWSNFWDEVHRDEVTGMKWHFFPLVWSAIKNEVPVVWSVWVPRARVGSVFLEIQPVNDDRFSAPNNQTIGQVVGLFVVPSRSNISQLLFKPIFERSFLSN